MNTSDDNEFGTYDKLFAAKGFVIDDILWLDPSITFSYDLISDFLIRKGIRKVALLKKSSLSDFEIIVKCPYCHNTFYQKEITRKFQCPNCMKTAKIITSIGGIGKYAYKKKNDTAYDNIPYNAADEQ